MNEILLKAYPVEVRVEEGERADVSTISTGRVDDVGDIVAADGLTWDTFKANGSQVFLEHHDICVGRALWTKKSGDRWVAKTQYSKAPANWPTERQWVGDYALEGVLKGDFRGKSVSLLIKSFRQPTAAEQAMGAKRVIDAADVCAYSVCKAPINRDAQVIVAAKAHEAEPVLYNTQHVYDRYKLVIETLDPEELAQRALRALAGKV